MSIQYYDGFSVYGTAAHMLDGLPWAAAAGSIVADPDGVSSGKVYEPFTNTSSSLASSDRIALPTPADKVGVALRWWMSSLPASVGVRPVLARYASAANSSNVIFTIEPNGAAAIYKFDASGESTGDLVLVEGTGSPVVAPQSHFHYEAMFEASTGAYELRIEGASVLSGTVSGARSTGVTGIIGFSRSMSTGGVASYMKDLVIWDGSGTQNNDFLGTVSVPTLPVNSDVSSGWTCSTGTSDFALLNELSPDDTGYISASNAPPAAAIMGFTDLAADVTSVKALMTVVRAKKSDGGDGKLQNSLLSSGDAAAGTDHPITTAMKYWWDVQELNPHTGTAWTPITANAATLKVDRTL